MDDTDWAVSPSKARIAQLHAKDWAVVDAWLDKLYISGGRVPTFERNADTLQTLLDLHVRSETVSEQRNAVLRVQKTALQHLNNASHGRTHDLTQLLLTSLGSDAAGELQSIAELAVELDTPVKNGSRALLAAIAHLQNSTFEAEQLDTSARLQLEALQLENRRLSDLINKLRGERFQTSGKTSEQTAEWARSSRQLKAKIAEHDERLAASQVSPAMQSLMEELGRVLDAEHSRPSVRSADTSDRASAA